MVRLTSSNKLVIAQCVNDLYGHVVGTVPEHMMYIQF